MKTTKVTEAEMQGFANKLSTKLNGGDIILLSGDLGAGKTTLTKAIAKSLGIEKTITSPTFTIMNVFKVANHKTINTLCHIDTYRIEKHDELNSIGIEEYLGEKNTICIIEWPEKIDPFLSTIDQTKIFQIKITGTGDCREITI